MKIRDRIKELRRVPASALRPNPKNWRTHPKEQADALRGTLAEIGFAEAVVARELPDGSLELIDGHLRAETVGDAEVPVLVLDVTEDEADKLLVTLDPLAAMATVDAEALASLVETVETDSEALRQMIDDLASDAGIEVEPEIVEDEVPEVPVDPITKPGDLWLLGEHRVLCGDSTKAEDVERLMGGEKVSALITDPPYGMRLDTDFRKMPRGENVYQPVIGDDQDFDFRAIEHLWSCSVMAVWGGGWFYSSLPAGGSWIIWDKQPHHIIAGPQNHFEECWIYPHRKRIIIRHLWTGYTAKEVDEERVHPTQKPVAVMMQVCKLLGDWDLCSDPFLGSGTTLIAAEQLGRRCFGMEISPAYCDVIVKRWETLTGKKATLAA